MSIIEFGGQGKNKAPRPKIQGTQNRWREEKQRPKLTIRNPFEKWKTPKIPRGAPGK